MGAFELRSSNRRAQPLATDRIIAVVMDASSEEVVKNLMLDQGISNGYVTRGQIDDAIELMRGLGHSPRHLLVDVSSSSMPVSDLMRLAEVVDPSVSVVVVGDRNDVGLFRSLLRMGVQDYLVKPLTLELLQRSFGGAGQGKSARQSRTGKVIGFAGTRGGVGVTTVAAGLARHLAMVAHRRIAYVDMNLHGGAANTLLGLKSNNGLLDVLRDADRLDPQFVERSLVAHDDRLFVLSAELPYGETFEPQERALADLLERLKPHFHYILLDLPGHGHALTHTALAEVQLLYLLADPSIHSAREVLRFTRYLDGVDRAPSMSVLLNVPNASQRGHLNTSDFAVAIGRNVLLELPFDGAVLATAENLGEPIAPGKSRFGDAIQVLADGLSGRPSAPAPRWYKSLLQKRRR